MVFGLHGLNNRFLYDNQIRKFFDKENTTKPILIHILSSNSQKKHVQFDGRCVKGRMGAKSMKTKKQIAR